MFKKGQLVRSATRRNQFFLIEEVLSHQIVSIFCLGSGLRGGILTKDIELVGNNYKEKSRDAIPERRDSYK